MYVNKELNCFSMQICALVLNYFLTRFCEPIGYESWSIELDISSGEPEVSQFLADHIAYCDDLLQRNAPYFLVGMLFFSFRLRIVKKSGVTY